MIFRKFLETAPEFSNLTPKDIEDFEHIMRVNEYPDEYEFFKQGSTSHDVYLILSGEVSVKHNKEIERGSVEVKRLKPGEMFGLLSAITDTKHEATCQAVGPVTLASMPRQAFQLLYNSNSPLALHFQQYVTFQLAKDYSALIGLLRNVLFAKNEDEILTAFNSINDQSNSNKAKVINERQQPVH